MTGKEKIQKIQGFTLVELAVVLTIIALIAGSALSLGSTRINAARVDNTLERMETIQLMIDKFVDKFGYLPCPANGALPSTDATFGRELVEDVNPGAGNPVVCAAATHSSVANISVGVLPVTTLNLNPSTMLDGWQRKFTYVMDERFRDNNGVQGFSGSAPTTEGAIGIDNDATHTPPDVVAEPGQVTGAVYVIVSHGPNGGFAWRAKGGQMEAPLNTLPLEVANCPYASGTACPGGDNQQYFIQRMTENNFDDVVTYRSYWQLAD